MRHLRNSVLAVLFLLALTPRAFTAEPAGRIGRLGGEVAIVRAGIEVIPSSGEAVQARDHLTTAAGGRLEAVFTDGTIIVLADASEVVIDAWAFNADDDQGRLFLRLMGGSIMVDAGRLAEQQLRLRTPVATVGVRGTRFWAGSLDGRFGILLLAGSVSVENTSGRVDLSVPGTGVFVAVPEGGAQQDLAEPAEAWIGPGAPPARGGPLSEPEPWAADQVIQALRAVSF